MQSKVTWEQAVRWLMNESDYKTVAKKSYFYENPFKAAQIFYRSAEFENVVKWLEKYYGNNRNLTLLDIGAGNGIATYAFAKQGCTVYALEPDSSKLVGQGAIQKIKQESSLDIRIVGAFAEDIPLGDESIDLVYARQALHHAQDLGRMMEEIYRVLKSDNYVITCRDHVVDNKQQLEQFLEQHPLHDKYGGEQAFSLEVYRRSFQQAGFQIIEEISTLENHVNYYPMNSREVEEALYSILRNHIGRYLTKTISLIPGWTNLLKNWLSPQYNAPGRLYSFILKK